MEKKDRKIYSRYHIVRGNHAYWKGDPTVAGSMFRQILITSDEFNSTLGIFQVYALENVAAGIKEGKFTTADNPKLLSDDDFEGFEAAAKKFDELARAAEAQGFRVVSMMDELEFQAKLRQSQSTKR
jgi:hypothetical protein